jgi:hypothetical protein
MINQNVEHTYNDISALKKEGQPGMLEHPYNPSYSGDGSRGITSLRPAWAKLVRPYLKN